MARVQASVEEIRGTEFFGGVSTRMRRRRTKAPPFQIHSRVNETLFRQNYPNKSHWMYSCLPSAVNETVASGSGVGHAATEIARETK